MIPRIESKNLLIGTFTQNYGRDGLENQIEVKKERLVLNVFTIHFNLFFKWDLTAPRNLPGTSQSRDNRKAVAICWRVTGHFKGASRAGANQSHFATDDIPQLGKLINAPAADDSSQPCDAGIIENFKGDSFAVDIALHQVDFERLGVDHHGPEFEAIKGNPVLADSLGQIKNWSTIDHANGEGN